MAHTTNTISAPVRLEQDVWPVLGVSGGLGYVIANANINMWAANKPFPYNSVSKVLGTTKSSTPRGIAVKYYGSGIVWNISDGFYSVHEMLEYYAVNSGYVTWEYDRPTGTIGIAPFRMLDFDGYHSDALSFVKTNISNLWTVNPTGVLLVPDIIKRRIDRVDTVAESGGISPFRTDCLCTLGQDTINNMYLGVAILNSSNNLVFLETFGTTIGSEPDTEQEIEIENFNLDSGWYEVFLFLSYYDLSEQSTIEAKSSLHSWIVPFGGWFAKNVAIINDIDRQVFVLVAVKQNDLYRFIQSLTVKADISGSQSYTFEFAENVGEYTLLYCKEIIYKGNQGLGAGFEINFKCSNPIAGKELHASVMSGNWGSWNVTALHSMEELGDASEVYLQVECNMTDSSTKPANNSAYGIIINR